MSNFDKPWRFALQDQVKAMQRNRFREGVDETQATNENLRRKFLGQDAASAFDDVSSGGSAPSGGGFLDRLSSLGSDLRNAVPDTFASARDLGGDIAHGRGRQALGDLAGTVLPTLAPIGDVLGTTQLAGKAALGAFGGVLGEPIDPVTGKRKHSNLFEQFSDPEGFLAGVAEGIRHPERAAAAMDQRAEDYGPVGRVAYDVASQPANFIPFGAAAKVLPGGRAVAALFDQGSPAAILAANSAIEADRELGDKIPGWADMDPTLRTTIAGVLGAHFGPKLMHGGVDAAKGAVRPTASASAHLDASHPNPDPYFEAAGRHGLDVEYDDAGNVHASDPEAARAKADALAGQATADLYGTKQPNQKDAGYGGPLFGTAERADWEARRAGTNGNGGQGTLPEYSHGAQRDLEDAHRLHELASPEPVDPKLEANRQPFADDHRMTVTPADSFKLIEDVKHLRDTEYATRDGRKMKLTQDNMDSVERGIQRADAYANSRLMPDYSPDALVSDIATHIERQGFDVGRVGLTVEENAYRVRLNQIAQEFEDKGHAAVHTAEHVGPTPAPDAVLGSGPAESGGRPADSGTASAPPEAAAFNAKTWYHGTGSELEAGSVSRMESNPDGLFGPGHYLTDNPDIAKGYARNRGRARGTGNGKVYATDVNVRNPLDLERPATSDVVSAIRRGVENIGGEWSTSGEKTYSHPDIVAAIDEAAAKPGATIDDVWQAMGKAIGEYSHEERIPTYEFGEFMDYVASNLMDLGYDSLTHTGGKRTGKAPHQVLILLDPNDELGRGTQPQIRGMSEHVPPSSAEGPSVKTGTDGNPASPGPEAASSGPETRQGPPPLDTSHPAAVLGLDPNGTYSPKELRDAYRAQMRRYHPDLNPSSTATQDAQYINAAYDYLAHGAAGGEWDFSGAHGSAGPTPAGAAGGGAGGVPPPPHPGSTPPPPPPPGPTAGAGAGGTSPPPSGAAPRYTQFADGETFDVFKAVPRSQKIREAQAWLDSAKGKFSNGLRTLLAKGLGKYDRNLILDSQITPFIVGEKNHTSNVINGWVKAARDLTETKFREAGLVVEQDANGDFRLQGSGVPLEDLVDARGRAANPAAQALFNSLTAEQRNALDFLARKTEEAAKTIEFHGGKLPPDVDLVGEYFPRKVTGIDGKARSAGSSSAHRSRTMEAVDDALGRTSAAGGKVTYGNPWDSFEAGLRGKLNDAQDAYIRESLEPLSVRANGTTIRKGFGFDTTDAYPFRGPHPLAPDMLFPQDVADRIRAAYAPPSTSSILQIPKDINSFLTPLRASVDFSGTLQQGAAFVISHPGQAAKAWAVTFRSLKNPDVYYGAMGKLDADGPGLTEHASWGAHWTGGKDDELLFPKIAEKLSGGRLKEVPVGGFLARKSNEHFERFLNLAKANLGNEAYERAIASGLTPGPELDAYMKKAWNAINRETGWTGRKPTSLESAFVFAARYTSATIEQIVAAFTKRDIEGAMARRHLVSLLGVTAATAYLVNMKQGYNTDVDPRSSNFLRMRNVGGLDVTAMGSYDVLVRAVAGTLGGKEGTEKAIGHGLSFGDAGLSPDAARALKLVQAKLAPVAKTVQEIMTGETYLGEPLDLKHDPIGVLKEEAKSTLPFSVQDAIEEGPLAAGIGATGLSARLRTPNETLSEARDKAAGGDYAGLPGAEKAKVNMRPEVMAAQDAADAQATRQGGDAAQQVRLRQHAGQINAANASFLNAGQDSAGNPYSGNDYRDAYHSLQQYLAGARSTLKQFAGDDKVLSGWFDIYDQATMANGKLDGEKLDALQGAYAAAHPGIAEKADAVIGIHDDATLLEYRQAQKLAQQYYDIPSVRGMSAADASRGQQLVQAASGLVSIGKAPNVRAGLRMLTHGDVALINLGMKVSRAKPNPDRKKFRKEQPLFDKFYTEAVAV